MMQKNKNRPGFKKTKLGWIPDEWEREKVKELFEVQLGKMLSEKARRGTQYPYLANFNVRWGSFNFSKTNQMAFSERERKKYALKDGDLLMCEGGEIGRCAVWRGHDKEIYYQKALHRIRPISDECSTEYLFVYMQFVAERGRLVRLVGETSIAHLTREKLLGLFILLPPFAEQKAIAGVLSEWDRAISTTERLIQSKEMRFKWLMSTLINPTDKSGWKTVKLGDVCDEVRRKVREKELVPYSISAGIGLVSQREKWGKNISGSQHKNYTHLKRGEIAYNKGNSKKYKQGCAYRLKEGEICVPNVFISFRANTEQLSDEFVELFFIANFHARQLKRYITSGARSDGLLNLNKLDFFKIEIPLPPLSKQKEIAETLNLAQREIDLLKKLAEKQKQQKRGLMQKLLTGTWRVNILDRITG